MAPLFFSEIGKEMMGESLMNPPFKVGLCRLFSDHES